MKLNKQNTIYEQMTVKELLNKYPETAVVFFRRKMSCVGCPAEEFGSLQYVACTYQTDVQQFIHELLVEVREVTES